MRYLFIITLCCLFHSCRNTAEKQEQTFAFYISKFPDLKLPVTAVVTDSDPGEKMGTQLLDSVFLRRYMELKKFDKPNVEYYVAGKKYLADSIVAVLYSAEISRGTFTIIENAIITFDRYGKKIDVFSFAYDICCDSSKGPDETHKKYLHAFHEDMTLQTTLLEYRSGSRDKEVFVVRYKISEKGRVEKL